MESEMEMLHLLQLAGLKQFSSSIEQELRITTIKQLMDPDVLYTKLKLIGMNECEVKKLNQTYKHLIHLKSLGYNSLLRKTRNNKSNSLNENDFLLNEKNKSNYQIWQYANEDETKQDNCNLYQTLDDFKKIEKFYYDYPNKYDVIIDENLSPRSSCSYKTSSSFDSSQTMVNTVKGKQNQFKNYLKLLISKKKKPNLTIDIPIENEESKESSEIKVMSDSEMKELELICDLANRFDKLHKQDSSSTSPSSKKTDSSIEESKISQDKCNLIKNSNLSDDSAFTFEPKKNLEASSSIKKVFNTITTNKPNPNTNIYIKKVHESKYSDHSDSVKRKRNKSESELKLPSREHANLAKSRSADENLENNAEHVSKIKLLDKGKIVQLDKKLEPNINFKKIKESTLASFTKTLPLRNKNKDSSLTNKHLDTNERMNAANIFNTININRKFSIDNESLDSMDKSLAHKDYSNGFDCSIELASVPTFNVEDDNLNLRASLHIPKPIYLTKLSENLCSRVPQSVVAQPITSEKQISNETLCLDQTLTEQTSMVNTSQESESNESGFFSYEDFMEGALDIDDCFYAYSEDSDGEYKRNRTASMPSGIMRIKDFTLYQSLPINI